MKTWEKRTMQIAAVGAMAMTLAGCATAKSNSSQGNNPGKTIKIGVNMEPVSYTHLTLPTILRV